MEVSLVSMIVSVCEGHGVFMFSVFSYVSLVFVSFVLYQILVFDICEIISS